MKCSIKDIFSKCEEMLLLTKAILNGELSICTETRLNTRTCAPLSHMNPA